MMLPASWVAFSILISETGPQGFHDSPGCEVLYNDILIDLHYDNYVEII